MAAIQMLNKFVNEMQTFISFSLREIYFYDHDGTKKIVKVVSDNVIQNSITVNGINTIIKFYNNDDIMFAILQKLGFMRVLSSGLPRDNIITNLKFIVDQLKDALNDVVSLETNDFNGRIIINMIHEMIMHKNVLESHFNAEPFIKNIYNACVDKEYHI